MPTDKLYEAADNLGKDGKPLVDYEKKNDKIIRKDQFKTNEITNEEAESERKYQQSKVDRNNEAAKNNPALKNLVDFANHNIGRNSGLNSLDKTVKKAKGGKVSSASKRADGCCVKGKTKGRMV
jgi:hypothetical protein